MFRQWKFFAKRCYNRLALGELNRGLGVLVPPGSVLKERERTVIPFKKQEMIDLIIPMGLKTGRYETANAFPFLRIWNPF